VEARPRRAVGSARVAAGGNPTHTGRLRGLERGSGSTAPAATLPSRTGPSQEVVPPAGAGRIRGRVGDSSMRLTTRPRGGTRWTPRTSMADAKTAPLQSHKCRTSPSRFPGLLDAVPVLLRQAQMWESEDTGIHRAGPCISCDSSGTSRAPPRIREKSPAASTGLPPPAISRATSPR
jgi:hypothetical protein